MNERKYSPEEMEMHKNAGVQRALCEHDLLLLMFNGFSVITLTKDRYDEVCMIETECSLKKYMNMTPSNTDMNYHTLTVKERKYFNLMVVLDSLETKGLVKKEIWVDDDHYINYELKDVANSVTYSVAGKNSWLAHELMAEEHAKEKFKIEDMSTEPTMYALRYIVYKLTKTGYEVAIRFMEHDDQNKRAAEQRKLSKSAVNAANSSAQTAKCAICAICAAIFIAIGSIGNLLLPADLPYQCKLLFFLYLYC